mgnify:CR=1 FL=1
MIIMHERLFLDATVHPRIFFGGTKTVVPHKNSYKAAHEAAKQKGSFFCFVRTNMHRLTCP